MSDDNGNGGMFTNGKLAALKWGAIVSTGLVFGAVCFYFGSRISAVSSMAQEQLRIERQKYLERDRATSDTLIMPPLRPGMLYELEDPPGQIRLYRLNGPHDPVGNYTLEKRELP